MGNKGGYTTTFLGTNIANANIINANSRRVIDTNDSNRHQ